MLTAPFRRQRGPTERKPLIAAIHALGHQLAENGLTDETRRDLQRELTGVESCRDMDVAQLTTVYRRLTVLAESLPAQARGEGRGARGRKRSGRDERLPEELASIEQTRLIAQLFACLRITEVGTARMRFCRRTCGASWPQTRAQANKVIEGLKKMQERQWRPREIGQAVKDGSVLEDRAVADSPRSTRALEPSSSVAAAEREG